MQKCATRLAVRLLLCLVTGFSILHGQEPAPPAPEYVAGEVIVRYRPESTRARRNAAIRGKGARVLRQMDALHIDRVQLGAGMRVEDAATAWAADSDILSVEPNYISRITALSNDPEWVNGNLWGMTKIQADQAWLFTTGGSDVVVANFDTGVNYAHPDLAANMWRNPGEIAGNRVDDDANGYVDDVYGIDTANDDSDPMDDHGHGTHAAGTIGAVGGNGTGVVGVNWNVKILPCKFIRADGNGADSNAIECFNYIVALRKKGVNIRVSSNSWGRTRSATGSIPTALRSAIDAAGAAGITNVFAAGNNGANNDVTPFDPASFTSASIVSVAASDGEDARAGFSNFGAVSVDLAAPGVSILSTHGGGYGFMSGTSMAAPHVAGAAALLSAVKPALSVTGLKSLLISSVDPIAGWSGVVASGGRLNVYMAALDAHGDIPPSVNVTSPASGTSFVAPMSTTVTATAADPDGTVSKVDFFANGTLIGTDTTSPYSASWTSSTAGAYALSAVATDDRTFTTTSAPVPVMVSSAAPVGSRVNVALASNGATASASSVSGSGYSPSGAINGDRKGASWGSGGGWNDGTATAFPDWLQVDFATAATIDEIDVFSVQDNYTAPATPTTTMTFSQYGLRDFQVQYWDGSGWQTVSGGAIAGNSLVWRQITFAPVTTSRIRVFVTNALNTWSRIAEVEAYSAGTAGAPAPPTSPSGRTNVALASNGAVASASSVNSSGYAASGAINGERNGAPWGHGGGWNDGTANAFPDWLQVDFAAAATIDEVDVFSVQDNYSAPSTPTGSMTFSLYGLKDFQVQYWTGTAWQTVPGGAITGNSLVWRQISFAPVTTSRIRVLITSALNTWSRVTEIEAYSSGSTPPPPPPSGRTNVALASNGATALASSVNSSGYSASGTINGDRTGALWGFGGGWNDATPNAYPDWLQVNFATAATIDEIGVFSVQDAYSTPSAPTASMTFSLYGLRDFQVQYWDGAGWQAVPGGVISGNTLVWRKVTFAPITTSRIRVFVTNALNNWSRVAEIEAYGTVGAVPPPPSGRINVALATTGASASASSVNGPGYAASGAINGDRKGTSWGSGGGWNDDTRNTFPDWLQVDFATTATIDEIDVFSVQDAYSAPAAPTAAMTFSLYGLTDFQVQYWDGGAWQTVPGGAITGNSLVWRQITFAPVTTSRIRVLITSALSSWSRVTEIEAFGTPGSPAPPPPASSLIGFPADNWWNRDISTAPVDPNSASYITFINNGGTRRLHPDFGGNVSPGSVETYGMPYVVVDSSTPKKAVQFFYASESDGVDHATGTSLPFYPIPDSAIVEPHMIEGGQPGNVDLRAAGDRHLLIVDKDKRHLYELFNVFHDGTRWHAGSGAFFDMNRNDRRPDGWTSADAAGLAILPGLVRYDEVYGSGEITHAFRVTVRATNGYVFPASHRAGSTAGALPMGARLRLKASKDLSGFSPEMQRIFRAMQRYGLIVADNGSDMFISGNYDSRWNNDLLNPAFRSLTASDFEVISLGYR